jgi:dephospho-CoA kinase
MKKIILGLTGEMASGKGTLATYLTDKYQANSHRFSTMLRDILKRLFIEQSRENLQNISTVLRQVFGEEIMAKVMASEAANDQADIVVIDGIRRQADIVHLTKLPEFKLIYLEADMELRYQRLTNRRENADDATVTWEEFQKAHQAETELQIKTLRPQADFIINNNGSISDLYQKIDHILQINE